MRRVGSSTLQARQRAVDRPGRSSCRRWSPPAARPRRRSRPGRPRRCRRDRCPCAVVRLRDGARAGSRPARLDAAVGRLRLLAHHGMRWPMRMRAVPDPPDGHAADVVVGRQVGHQQLERMVRARRSAAACGADQLVEAAAAGRCPAGARSVVAVPALAFVYTTGKSICWRVRAKVDEQLVDRVEHLRRARVAAVDLVDAPRRPADGGPSPSAARSASAAAAPPRRRRAAGSQSTMSRVRSTSPPKSAWPGVSTMLSRAPRRGTRRSSAWPGS